MAFCRDTPLAQVQTGFGSKVKNLHLSTEVARL